MNTRSQTFATEESGDRMPLPSGLSALIQAATSQLGLLAEESPNPSQMRLDRPRHVVTEGGESGGERTREGVITTPTMVPEPDPRKQSFAELLMTLALDPSNNDTIAFLPDGKFFAIRMRVFADSLMITNFAVATFAEFMDLLKDWGFTRFTTEQSSQEIEVFRHPNFLKGDWAGCAKIRFGESPQDARISALPEGARIDCALSDETNNSSKRRLSPGFLSRRASETSVTSQKQRMDDPASRRSSIGSDVSELPRVPYFAGVSRTDDLRSIALAITAEKLNIGSSSESPESSKVSPPLIETAVQSATHNIVTDAIESLLRDENHTKETYRKHEEKLSRSSVPGLVPISTQLFSLKSGGDEPSDKCPESDAVK